MMKTVGKLEFSLSVMQIELFLEIVVKLCAVSF